MGEEMNRYGDAQIREYVCRINRVLDYLDNHLEEVFNIGDLARIAGFSPFHFHRIFSAMLGETLFPS
jgi:AraC family transcriptional regulator